MQTLSKKRLLIDKHLPVANCATLVLSRQSMQLVLSAPFCSKQRSRFARSSRFSPITLYSRSRLFVVL